MKINTYKDSGVDIDKGNKFADFISRIKSKAVGSIGNFAGGIELNIKNLKEPVILSTTDGVGTKLLVAKRLNKFDTIGIDLVAMCVNDLLVCGAKPLAFLDYIACGKIDEKKLHNIIKGIVKGCEKSSCKLSGGETAEMPDMYTDDDIDLAGFCYGIVEKSEMLPKKDMIKEGDIIFGIPSSGIHSNGLSLARKVLSGDSEWEQLLIPTKIYSSEMEILNNTGKVLSAAHITGGGLKENLLRVIPDNFVPELLYNWEVHDIFKIIQKKGSVSDNEMRRVFNMGIGLAFIVHKEHKNDIMELTNIVKILEIGKIICNK